MKKIFIDMDGTIAEWLTESSFEEVASAGYFRSLPPMESMLLSVRNLIDRYANMADFYILSSVLRDNHSVQEKIDWLERHLNRKINYIFVPYGDSKAVTVEKATGQKISRDYVLIDDFSNNLHDWENLGGTGLKVYNGINGKKGTWRGYSVHSNMEPEHLTVQLAKLAGIA